MQQQVESKLSGSQREWRLRQGLETQDSDLHLQKLQAETGLSEWTLRVCWARGLRDAASVLSFLGPRLDALSDPYCCADMDSLVNRLVRARELGESILIYGDYDVDGTTGAALLYRGLSEFGFTRLSVRQPDRFKEGYGVHAHVMDEALEQGVRVVLTVDCGITSFVALERARELGLDVLVVDHHQLDPVRGLPPAVAVVNPQRPDCPSGLKQLCGCGLAFTALRALRSRGRDLKWWPLGQEPNLKQHLDLVVIATAADIVPLTGENHILVRHGMEVLKNSKKPGVKALLQAAGLEGKDLSPGHLGFTLGPRINASGRMGSAGTALELLVTDDALRARDLALELERVNKERADVQNEIWDQVKVKVEAGLSQGLYQHAIVVSDLGWHEGVVGIVASRVTETFQKPAIVMSAKQEEGYAKGSVRSYGGKDVLGGLQACASLLKTFGGHKHAAGVSVLLDNLDAFMRAFDAAIGALPQDADALPLYVEGECSVEDFNLKTLQELESLGPFGPGNPEPVFVCSARVKGHRVLKERHLKLQLGGDRAGIEAIWFHAAENRAVYSPDALEVLFEEAEFAAVPEINRFRGNQTPTLRIRDWRLKL